LIRNITVPDIEKIYLVDNLATQRYSSLFDLPQDQAFEFHHLDVISEDMRPIIEDCDVLIHLAAVTDAESSFHNQEMVEKTNKYGLENVAKLCAELNTSLIFPSTTSVYGSQEELVDESCDEPFLKPQSPYAESKLFGEKMLASLGKEKGLKFITLRLGTIFGYSIGMRFHTAVNKFLWQASLGENITVWKTALHQKRPYCDLIDAASAMNFIIEKNLFVNDIYNIVTVNLTVNDIIETIKQNISEVNIEFVDSPIMNQLSYEVSREKSIAAGFKYQGILENSLKETIEKLKGLRTNSAQVGL